MKTDVSVPALEGTSVCLHLTPSQKSANPVPLLYEEEQPWALWLGSSV
jgi:hypothetical protein